MTPIQRVSIKSKALAVLGLSNSTASKDDIRSAYRDRVREKHPDRCNGASEEFMRITEAFEFLCGETESFDHNPSAPTEKHSARPASRTPRPTMDFSVRPSRTRSETISRPVSRPSVQATQTKFTTDILSACKNLLGEDEGLLATHLQRAGRSLTYFVPVRLLNNVNNVALPTGDLVDARHVRPTLLKIEASEINGGTYRVPSDHLEDRFPGARRVEIRFLADI